MNTMSFDVLYPRPVSWRKITKTMLCPGHVLGRVFFKHFWTSPTRTLPTKCIDIILSREYCYLSDDRTVHYKRILQCKRIGKTRLRHDPSAPTHKHFFWQNILCVCKSILAPGRSHTFFWPPTCVISNIVAAETTAIFFPNAFGLLLRWGPMTALAVIFPRPQRHCLLYTITMPTKYPRRSPRIKK